MSYHVLGTNLTMAWNNNSNWQQPNNNQWGGGNNYDYQSYNNPAPLDMSGPRPFGFQAGQEPVVERTTTVVDRSAPPPTMPVYNPLARILPNQPSPVVGTETGPRRMNQYNYEPARAPPPPAYLPSDWSALPDGAQRTPVPAPPPEVDIGPAPMGWGPGRPLGGEPGPRPLNPTAAAAPARFGTDLPSSDVVIEKAAPSWYTGSATSVVAVAPSKSRRTYFDRTGPKAIPCDIANVIYMYLLYNRDHRLVTAIEFWRNLYNAGSRCSNGLIGEIIKDGGYNREILLAKLKTWWSIYRLDDSMLMPNINLKTCNVDNVVLLLLPIFDLGEVERVQAWADLHLYSMLVSYMGRLKPCNVQAAAVLLDATLRIEDTKFIDAVSVYFDHNETVMNRLRGKLLSRGNRELSATSPYIELKVLPVARLSERLTNSDPLLAEERLTKNYLTECYAGMVDDVTIPVLIRSDLTRRCVFVHDSINIFSTRLNTPASLTWQDAVRAASFGAHKILTYQLNTITAVITYDEIVMLVLAIYDNSWDDKDEMLNMFYASRMVMPLLGDAGLLEAAIGSLMLADANSVVTGRVLQSLYLHSAHLLTLENVMRFVVTLSRLSPESYGPCYSVIFNPSCLNLVNKRRYLNAIFTQDYSKLADRPVAFGLVIYYYYYHTLNIDPEAATPYCVYTVTGKIYETPSSRQSVSYVVPNLSNKRNIHMLCGTTGRLATQNLEVIGSSVFLVKANINATLLLNKQDMLIDMGMTDYAWILRRFRSQSVGSQ